MTQPATGERKNGNGKAIPGGRLLTLVQARDYLGAISPWMLRDLVHKGVLPVVVLNGEEGSKWYFDRQDLDALIERSKKTF